MAKAQGKLTEAGAGAVAESKDGLVVVKPAGDIVKEERPQVDPDLADILATESWIDIQAMIPVLRSAKDRAAKRWKAAEELAKELRGSKTTEERETELAAEVVKLRAQLAQRSQAPAGKRTRGKSKAGGGTSAQPSKAAEDVLNGLDYTSSQISEKTVLEVVAALAERPSSGNPDNMASSKKWIGQAFSGSPDRKHPRAIEAVKMTDSLLTSKRLVLGGGEKAGTWYRTA